MKRLVTASVACKATTYSHGSAIHVDLFDIQSESLDAVSVHRSKGLVNLMLGRADVKADRVWF